MRILSTRALPLFFASIILWPALASATPQPAPPGGPIAAFAAHDPDSTAQIPHSTWKRILELISDDMTAGRRPIRYDQLSDTALDRLDSYIAILEGTNVEALNRNEQLAFWLNLYNATSLKLTYAAFDALTERTGATSGRDVFRTPKLKLKRSYLGKSNDWAEKRLTVGGESLSLNDIEHRILYAHWDPALVMYGLSCPAKGCPSLQPVPFRGHKVMEQLRSAAREFIARKDGVKPKGSKVDLSEIYEWQMPLFGNEQALLQHLKTSAGPARAAELATATRIGKYDFSWSLNGKQPPPNYRMPQGTVTRGVSPGNF